MLRLGVRRRHLRVGEPRRVRRRLARQHHVGQRAHPVVELAAHLVAQVVAVVRPRRLHEVRRRVRRQRVRAVGRADERLDRHERRQQRLQPRRVHFALLLQPRQRQPALTRRRDRLEHAHLEPGEERLRRHEAVRHRIDVDVLDGVEARGFARAHRGRQHARGGRRPRQRWPRRPREQGTEPSSAKHGSCFVGVEICSSDRPKATWIHSSPSCAFTAGAAPAGRWPLRLLTSWPPPRSRRRSTSSARWRCAERSSSS